MALPEKKVQQDTKVSQRDVMRFELAKSAIAGVALHRLDKKNLVAEDAVKLADAVLAELEKGDGKANT